MEGLNPRGYYILMFDGSSATHTTQPKAEPASKRTRLLCRARETTGSNGFLYIELGGWRLGERERNACGGDHFGEERPVKESETQRQQGVLSSVLDGSTRADCRIARCRR